MQSLFPLFLLLSICCVLSVHGQEELAEAMKRSASLKCPSPVCYKRVQHCCFVYYPCGTVSKPGGNADSCKKKKKICVKRTVKRCKKICETGRETIKRKVCHVKLVRAGSVCGKVWVTRDGKRECIKVCKPRFKNRKFCKTETIYKPITKCINDCKKVTIKKCKVYIWNCCGNGPIKYPKYCPKLICASPKYDGNSKKPAYALHPSSFANNEKCSKKAEQENESQVKKELEKLIDQEN